MMNKNSNCTHVHYCIPIDREEEDLYENIQLKLRQVYEEIHRDHLTCYPLTLHLNVLYFGFSKCMTPASMTYEASANNESAVCSMSTTPSSSTSAITIFPAKSLLNMNLQLSDLESRDINSYEHVLSNCYGKVFGSEDHLREKIRGFVSAKADRRKIVILDHADQLSFSMQSELREYTGRSTDQVQFIFISYPSRCSISNITTAESSPPPLVFLESLQSRLTTRMIVNTLSEKEEKRKEEEDVNLEPVSDFMLLQQLFHSL